MASTVGALPHSEFMDAAALTTVPSAVPAAVPQTQAPSGTPAKGSKSKNLRSSTGSSKSSKSDSGPSTETTLPTLDFELSPDTPADVRKAIYAKAEAAKRTPSQLTYPWEGIPLWYEPEDYPGIHVTHWRFWNAFRATFLEWALHAPLASSSAQAQRRKRKMAAIRERRCFLSLCIETWGYYNFLRRLERRGTAI
ncbi:hypothetical protein PF010_g1124 [Phytophthora fragariae]|uniref:Uncharacterized protein n=1 Tax=Phytophthora fragariae TaxID=53985 RepID=A0A6A4EV15_9STRA|nr:hypothetical protein PF003_g5389 [Phytophthora fragariae]KAE8949004.1 hypothetical protein PF009_g1446 [Phytophthora fragariae]KAE9137897.1 hypothetical protein PF010_g1124 [Phytophthora fragariae]KAE9138708.1 hypothetical protein PF007_g1287 [Phytophthora fragariae]KAE9152898.1 hypothetical protein PF006_g2915 [Phytophthora fragariae]